MQCKKTKPHLNRRDAMLCLYRTNDPQYPQRLNFVPSVRDLVKRNVTESTEGFSANSEQLQTQENGCSNASLLNCDSSAKFRSETEALVEQNELLKDVVSSLREVYCDFNLDDSFEYVPLDEKDEMIIGLLQ